MSKGENGFCWCVRWLLAADDVGIGGENGNGGYCIDVLRLMFGFEIADVGTGMGSSSPNDTPRARSLASESSRTYASHSEKSTG